MWGGVAKLPHLSARDLGSWCGGIGSVVKGMRLVQSKCALCACGVRAERPRAHDSLRFQRPNLGKAVRDVVGEMCPNPAPATEERPASENLSLSGRIRRAGSSLRLALTT